MHILHITPYYAPAYSFGGVVRAVEGIAMEQVAQGHQVTVLTTDAFSRDHTYTQESNETQSDVQIIRVKNWIYALRRFNLSTPFQMRSIMQSLAASIDVVHLHEFRTLENLLTVSAFSGPIILSPHGTLTRSTGRSLFKRIWDHLLSPVIVKHLDHVVALAGNEQNDVRVIWQQMGWGEIPVNVIPNGIDLTLFDGLPDATVFRQQYNIPSDAHIILFLGRLHRRKGVHLLVEAVTRLQNEQIHLVLAGPDEGMYTELAPRLNPRIHLTGYLTGEERMAALAAADLFVLPAIGEGLSMAVLEAMTCYLPVILSPGCNLPEVEAAGAGVIVEPVVDDLTATLAEMVSQPEKLHNMGKNARLLIEDRFTLTNITERLIQLYTTLLAKKQGDATV